MRKDTLRRFLYYSLLVILCSMWGCRQKPQTVSQVLPAAPAGRPLTSSKDTALFAYIGREGHFIHGQIHSFRQQRDTGPLPDSTQAAAKEIKQLTESDFPQSPVFIYPDGGIKCKK